MVSSVEHSNGGVNEALMHTFTLAFAEEPLVANVEQVYQQRQDNYE